MKALRAVLGPVLALLSVALGAAAPEKALQFPNGGEDKLDAQAGFVAALLKAQGSVYFMLPEEALPSRDAQGRWKAEPLKAALSDQAPLVFSGDADKAGQGRAGLSFGRLPRNEDGRWLLATGLPKVLVLENSSTVSPLSKGLDAWQFPYQKAAFSAMEAEPRRWLDPAAADLVIFSSPGWWEDFADPPGGPSRMPAAVAEALRDFVRQGGAALFIDISQWDLEKAWPRSVSLAPLGPYAVSKLKLANGSKGGLSLAPVGVAADKLQQAGAFSLAGSDSFDFPDGGTRPLHAAYAMPDPGGGQGWVAGLAFHVFDQDDSLGAAARRLLLNLLLLAGNRRLATQGEPKAPTPEAATATRTPERSATVTPTERPPTPTPRPSDTAAPESPTPLATATPPPTATPLPPTAVPPTPVPPTAVPPSPTAVPTLAPPPPTPSAVPAPPLPTALPTAVTPSPTRWPTLSAPQPTAVPPSPVPTARPTPVPPPLPSPVPTRRPSPLPTLAPTTAVPTLRPSPPLPTLRPTTPVAWRPRPTLVPTRIWHTPVPTWTWPTPLPTLVRPTPLPTLPPPKPLIVPTVGPRPHRRPTRIPATATPWVAPSPRPTAQLTESVRNALGCLASGPEPFTDGGVYISFCLSHAASVQVEVFDTAGKRLWSSSRKKLGPGSHQWYFDGRANGARLPAGPYLYQVEADYGRGRAEARQGQMTRARGRR